LGVGLTTPHRKKKMNLLQKFIKKNIQTLMDASKDVGLEVNTEITKYMLMPHHQNAGQNHDTKVA
jgi:hypothetical protein